jgi:hypothetical protein
LGSTSFDQEGFLIECHAIGGYSGSPVFVYITEAEERPPDLPWLIHGFPPHLLGIEWGVLSKWEPVSDATGRPVGHPPANLQVDVNSGMMGVVPVWKLAEILDLPIFADQRKKDEEEYFKQEKTDAPAAAPTSATRQIKVTPPESSS